MASRKDWMWCQSVEPITSRTSMRGCMAATGRGFSIAATPLLSTSVTFLSLEHLPECSDCRGNRLLSRGFQVGAERGEILHCHIGIQVVFYVIIVAVYNITINRICSVRASIQKYITF